MEATGSVRPLLLGVELKHDGGEPIVISHSDLITTLRFTGFLTMLCCIDYVLYACT